MSIGIKELLEHSFVISTDDFRYNIFCERFLKYKLNNPLPKLYKGFQLKNGIYKESGLIKTKNLCNCYFTHIALVKMAQSLGWKYICIFEDDALPCKNILEKLQYYLNSITDDIDILKLGHLRYINKPIQINDNFIKVFSYGSHAYIIFKKYYDDYINIAQNKDFHVDNLCMNNKDKNIYTTRECLFIQEDSKFKTTVLHTHNIDQQFFMSTKIANNFEFL